MTAVAVLWPKVDLYKGKAAAHPHRFWYITWRGPCGAFSSGVPYGTQARAESMARECGAQETELLKDGQLSHGVAT